MPSEALQYLNNNSYFINHDVPAFYHESDGKVVYIYTTDGALVDEGRRSFISAAVIHGSVEMININAFKGFSRLKSVEFQDYSRVHTIGTGAFEDCFALVEIDLSFVRVISEDAFCNCMALARVTFGSRLRLIGTSAFRNCISLVSIIIPTVVDIECSAFRQCRSLTTIELPEEVRSIQEYSFAGCSNLTGIIMPLINNMYGEVLQPNVFFGCNRISQVELRLTRELVPFLGDKINRDISFITDVFQATSRNKTAAMQIWIESVCDVYKQHIVAHYNSINVAELVVVSRLLDMMSDDHEQFGIGKDSIRQELKGCGVVKIVVEEVKSYLQLPSSMKIMSHGIESKYMWRNGRFIGYSYDYDHNSSHSDSDDDDDDAMSMCSNESNSSASSIDSNHPAYAPWPY
eukprot:scaffold12895_cov164-Skeletonema_dohrnii-CCMP3373.AAC.1